MKLGKQLVSKLAVSYLTIASAVATTVLTSSVAASAAPILVYGNNAGSGTDNVNSFLVNQTTGTGTFVKNYTPSQGNGRSVVVVGNIMYTTVVSDSHIYKTNVTTGASLGTINTSLASFSTLAWDGQHFWTTDYSGTNKGFEISTTGKILKTLTFSKAGGGMDGMEWFNGKLIVNRGDADGIYDIYDLNGKLLKADFFKTAGQNVTGTGVAFDGKNFLVSRNFDSIDIYNGTTGAFIKNVALTGATALIEDLSVNYAARADTSGVVLGPTIPNFTITLVDQEAIFSAKASALPVALSQRENLLSVNRTVTGDINARLFRLHSTSEDLSNGFAQAGPDPGEQLQIARLALSNNHGGKDTVAADGKTDKNPVTPEGFRRFELFAEGDFDFQDLDRTGNTAGFDFDSQAATVGGEFRVNRNLALGVAGSYVDSHAYLTNDLGKTDIDGFAVSSYVTWFYKNFYADALYAFSDFEDEISRNTLLGTTAHATPQSYNHTINFNTGYNLKLGSVVTGPIGALEYVNGHLDSYREHGAGRADVNVGEQHYDSLISRLGWQVSIPLQTRFGTVTPQIRASWDRQNLDGSDRVSVGLNRSPITIINSGGITHGGRFTTSGDTQAPGDDYLNVGGGLLVNVCARGQVVFDYEAHLAQRNNVEQLASVKVGLKF